MSQFSALVSDVNMEIFKYGGKSESVLTRLGSPKSPRSKTHQKTQRLEMPGRHNVADVRHLNGNIDLAYVFGFDNGPAVFSCYDSVSANA